MYLITIVVVGCCVRNVDSRIIFVILVGCCVGYITTTSRDIIPQDQNSVFYSSGKKTPFARGATLDGKYG
jgi:hypothetical protein